MNDTDMGAAEDLEIMMIILKLLKFRAPPQKGVQLDAAEDMDIIGRSEMVLRLPCSAAETNSTKQYSK